MHEFRYADSYLRDNPERRDLFFVQRSRLGRRRPSLPHKHDFFELIWVEQGTISHRCNDVEEQMIAGDLRFIRPDDCHLLHEIGEVESRFGNLLLRAEVIESLGNRFTADFEDKFFWSCQSQPDKARLSNLALGRFIRLVDQSLNPSQQSHLIAETFLCYFITQILGLESRLTKTAPAWLAEACEAMRADDKLVEGTSALVSKAGRTHAHVCRAMQRYMGRSPHDYVNAVRMERAAELLVRTDLKVSNIGESVGLQNASHFHKLFLKRYGQSPMKFRKINSLSGLQ
mgnify:CR=1 FL=1